MKYRLLLTNTADGEEREIIVPDNLPLEDLCSKMKVEFKLPLSDNGWHRFLSHGTAYVINEHLAAEPEILSENNLYVGRYRCSERVRLRDVFTVLGSTVTYVQDDGAGDEFKIRITLLERTVRLTNCQTKKSGFMKKKKNALMEQEEQCKSMDNNTTMKEELTEILDALNEFDFDDDDDSTEDYESKKKEQLETEAKLMVKDFETSLAFLDDMVGMEHVKQKLLRLGHYAQWMKKMEIAGFDVNVLPQPNLTFMFLGDPGTGKTTVANEMGRILKSIGLLSFDNVHEYRRENLVGQNYGAEEQNTRQALNEAAGGVFFLDEAYQCFKHSTDPRDPGYHILETMMQDFGKPFRCIIMAGYKNEMLELFKVNPGFRSRIPDDNIIEFTGPSEQMLMDVATNAFHKMSLDVTQDADEMLRQHIHSMWVNKEKDFGNARVIRQLAEAVVINHANRIMTTTDDDDFTISESDVRQSLAQPQMKTPTRSHIGFV